MANCGLASCIDHPIEHWFGRRIHADVFKRTDLGMALHVRLTGKDVDLQRLFWVLRKRWNCKVQKTQEDPDASTGDFAHK